VLAGLLDAQVAEIDLADVDTTVRPPGQTVEQVTPVEVQALQLGVLVRDDLRQEAVLADVVAQVRAEVLRGLDVVVLLAVQERVAYAPCAVGAGFPAPPGFPGPSEPVLNGRNWVFCPRSRVVTKTRSGSMAKWATTRRVKISSVGSRSVRYCSLACSTP